MSILYTSSATDRCGACGHLLSSSLKPLTRRQREIFNYLRDYIRDNGFAPSFDEIARDFDYASLATVHEHLTNIERKGWIRRHYNEARSIEVVREDDFPSPDRSPSDA